MPATVTVEELRAKAKHNIEEARKILVNPDASAEDKEKIEPLMEDAKAWNAQALSLREIENTLRQAEEEIEEQMSGHSGGSARGSGSGFKDWGDFLQAIWRWSAEAKRDKRLISFRERHPEDNNSEQKDLSEGVGSAGGFLVQPDFYSSVMAASAENAIVRPRATRIRMARRQVNIPVLDQTGTTTGVPH